MPPENPPAPAKILVIDDTPANVLLLQAILRTDGYEITPCTRSVEAMRLFEETRPDLIVLDLHMPELDGYALLKLFRESAPDACELPILVFTADVTSDACVRALELGASDFLTKPGVINEIKLKVRNFLTTHRLFRQVQAANQHLEEKVQERTRSLWESQLEVVERLVKVGERRDDQTGAHARRVGEISAQIAKQMGLGHADVQLIRLAAPLHDIGKVGISDTILLKRGMLTDVETQVMRTHPVIGAEILSGGRSALLTMAEAIARSHHEHWNGLGYPDRLQGEEIPLVGRIVAVADAYDALTSERSYKRAHTHYDAMAAISADSGRHFDPAVVRALDGIAHLLHAQEGQAA